MISKRRSNLISNSVKNNNGERPIQYHPIKILPILINLLIELAIPTTANHPVEVKKEEYAIRFHELTAMSRTTSRVASISAGSL